MKGTILRRGRRAKAKAIGRGLGVVKAEGRRPSLLTRAGDLCGCLDSRVTDLATNPRHLEGFGTWAR